MSKIYRINDQIQEAKVKLILEDGKMHGDVTLKEAKDMADERDLDLVEVSPFHKGQLAICKLMDYGKVKYKEAKRKKSKKEVIKDIKIGLNISDHDLQVKNKKVKECISKGYKVRYSLELRGRELGKKDRAEQKMQSILEQFSGKAQWDKVHFSGRNFITTLKPI